MKYSLVIFLFLISCNKPVATQTDIIQQVNYYNEQYLSFQRVDINKAALFADSILLVAVKHKYTKGIALANLNYGLLEQIKANYSAAIKYNEKALALFKSIHDDSLTAKTYAALGTNYWQRGENDKAMQYHLDALKINERLQIKNEMAVCYNYISMVYQSKNQLALAEEFANKSFNIIQTQAPYRGHISTYHNLANIYGMQEKYSKALSMDSIGLSLCEKLNIDFNKSMFYDNIANCFYYSGNFDKSIEYHFKAIAIDSTFRNNKQLGDSYCNLGSVLEAQKKYDQAILYYQKSAELCNKAGYKAGVRNAYDLLADVYSKINQPALAYNILRKSIAVKDSIINEKSESKIAELQTLYDTEKKQQQIIQQELKISRRNILLMALFLIFILSLLSYYLLYNRYKLRQEQKLQQELLKEGEKRTQAILESEENERQRLARELHDGVGQLLSVTKLNLSTLNSNNSTFEEKDKLRNSMDILDDSIKEIRNISHNMVPDVLLKSGLEKAIDGFISRINQTKKLEIHFECNGFKESSLEDTSKLMLYRIIQESVNNTIKYAQATHMTIQLSADANEISLLMEDNGKGFDMEEARRKGGIGFKNMQLRTEYLKGKLEIESSLKNGTTIIIEIPLS